jgi:hypothetical protein
VIDARVVMIQPRFAAAPVKFRIDDFDAALQAAQDAGCDASSFDLSRPESERR